MCRFYKKKNSNNIIHIVYIHVLHLNSFGIFSNNNCELNFPVQFLQGSKMFCFFKSSLTTFIEHDCVN